jgi:hypothetical protein
VNLVDPEYRFEPGVLVRVCGKRNKTFTPLHRTHDDANHTTTVVRAPVGEQLLITDYFNKEHPGLYAKWYVMYKEKIWWVYDDELEKNEKS